jgi:hypothetical protein
MDKRILFLTAICIILLMSFALACCCPIAIPWGGNNSNDNSNTTGTSTIKGTCIINTNDGTQPVGNISVHVGDHATTTDGNGYFEVTGLAAGNYDVQVSGGDLGRHENVTVKAGETLNLGDLELGATLPLP